MTDQEKVDLILESIREEVTEFVKQEGDITSSTAYEDKLLAIARKFAVGLAKHSSSPLPKSRNAKKKS